MNDFNNWTPFDWSSGWLDETQQYLLGAALGRAGSPRINGGAVPKTAIPAMYPDADRKRPFRVRDAVLIAVFIDASAYTCFRVRDLLVCKSD